MTETRSLYELNQDFAELDRKVEWILQRQNECFEQLFTLQKTVEGMQQLFVKAGEYQGKPRGRLPKDRR